MSFFLPVTLIATVSFAIITSPFSLVCLKDSKYSPPLSCFSGTATNSPTLSLVAVAITVDPEIISILEFGIPLPAITKLPSGLTLITSSLIVSPFCFLDVLTSIGLASTTSFTRGTTNSFSSIKFGW